MKCDTCGVDECEIRDIVLKKYPDPTNIIIITFLFVNNIV
ncbi:unnamed protein product [marine sediment metagenome]|uniref:Uncharacterized protein n=1 Tax=marine sediment metagenome TaxID=412755 RepID=X1FZ16_9ZZZZ